MYSDRFRKRKTDRVNGGEIKKYRIERKERETGYTPLTDKTPTYENMLEKEISYAESVKDAVKDAMDNI